MSIRLITGPAAGVVLEDDDERLSRDRLSLWFPTQLGDARYTRPDPDFSEMFFDQIDAAGLATDRLGNQEPEGPDQRQLAEKNADNAWQLTI